MTLGLLLGAMSLLLSILSTLRVIQPTKLAGSVETVLIVGSLTLLICAAHAMDQVNAKRLEEFLTRNPVPEVREPDDQGRFSKPVQI